MSADQRILTGITTTGSPHLGNYVGAIRPAIAASRTPGITSFYFLADYHALIKCVEPKRIQESTLEIAATWLALGLDPDKVYFYRQSDIPEIPELTWLLTCVTAKGLLNRAHAYKAATDANRSANEDPDAGINAGLYMYPVLMAADILMFNANRVPVGRDQVQHIEMARDIAQRFNHIYGGEYFALPEAVIEESVATLPGLDGRKMSKSYNNTIPLWLDEKSLKKSILGIVTNSLAPGAPKNPDDSNIFTVYQAFATTQEAAAMRNAFHKGIAWGDAKQALFERINAELGEARERYNALIGRPQHIEEILQHGGNKARGLAAPFLRRLREAVGLRALQPDRVNEGSGSAQNRQDRSFKPSTIKGPYPENGKFFFRVHNSIGQQELLSVPFDDFREAGQIIRAMKNTGKQDFSVHAVESENFLFYQGKKAALIMIDVSANSEDLERQVFNTLDRCIPESAKD